ncbi:FecR family protein [Alkalinema pantanalense CENA528]|uniref:FecR family protein n=1 Tax=Alkalinema pantanalense TaxID=1620705 RepID=UPI003D6F9D13
MADFPVSSLNLFLTAPHSTVTLQRLTRLLLTTSIGLLLGTSAVQANDVTLPKGQRSLEVRQTQGKVTYKGSRPRPAQSGDRLSAGQGLTTGPRSSAVVGIDSNIGIVKVAEKTDFTVRNLTIAADGGRVTLLTVYRGQVALQVRPFTNKGSRLEVKTPSGIAGVRGTEFGVAVSPQGRTAILTNEGTVSAEAQGQSILVGAGYSSLIYPGEPPTPARPTVEDLSLKLKTADAYRSGLVRVGGHVDPINTVIYENQELEVARDGSFHLESSTQQRNWATIVVRTPLGNEKIHTIWLR